MSINFGCPQCGRNIKVRDETAGGHGKCPDCNAPVQVPIPAMPKPPPTSMASAIAAATAKAASTARAASILNRATGRASPTPPAPLLAPLPIAPANAVSPASIATPSPKARHSALDNPDLPWFYTYLVVMAWIGLCGTILYLVGAGMIYLAELAKPDASPSYVPAAIGTATFLGALVQLAFALIIADVGKQLRRIHGRLP